MKLSVSDRYTKVKFKVSFPDEGFKILCGNSSTFLLIVRSSNHCLLYDVSYLLCSLTEYFIHILCHWMVSTEVLVCRLSSLSVRIKRGLVLFKEFLFNCYIMVSNTEYGQSIFRFLEFSTATHFILHANLGDQLVLN